MNDESPRCDLCREALIKAANRTCGLDLCDPCYTSSLRQRLAPRGFVIELEKWVSKSNSDDGVSTHHTRVTGTVRSSIQPRAAFTREALGTRIKRFFGRGDLEVGDSLFDDNIWVDTDTEEQTRAMLAEVGLQDVIFEAVNDFGGIRFSPAEGGCTVMVHSTWNKNQVTPDVFSHQRVVSSALHYLEQVKA